MRTDNRRGDKILVEIKGMQHRRSYNKQRHGVGEKRKGKSEGQIHSSKWTADHHQ